MWDREPLQNVSGPLMTLTLVQYRWWAIPLAFLHMTLHGLRLRRTAGLTFWQLLGTGLGGAFRLTPDLQQWGLFAVWENVASARQFFTASFIAHRWRQVGRETWTVALRPLRGHGYWAGVPLFGEANEHPESKGHEDITTETQRIAVLTRARIRLLKAPAFWRQVQPVARSMRHANGLLFSVSMGEAPLVRQATLSIWQSTADMEAFAYSQEAHREVIRKTRAEGWYGEEMFARLEPLATEGTIHGRNPLE